MIIKIPQKNCPHIPEVSYYGHCCHSLPFEIEECNAILEEYGGDESFYGYSIGIIVDYKFIPKFYLHQNENDEFFTFDSETISKENKWT